MLAAVDLGSNSFRMVIARVAGEEIQLVDRLRDGVRLAGSLDDRQRLTREGQDRAIACLRKFGQRLRDFSPGSVRAVGTNTLRKARNTKKFLPRATEALGHPIEVISGQEEARLIFVGSAYSLAEGPGRRLVVDIGGGSTECIVGEGDEPSMAESLYMGCVGYTLAHFRSGKISRKKMRRAEIAAQLELRPVTSDFRHLGWDRAVGASGTIHAVADILRLNGWSDHGISPEGLARLREALLEAGHVDRLSLKGLRKDRARVLPGGVAILSAVFNSLGISNMVVSPGALREGVLYDLLGRWRHEDVRDRTIQRFIQQYHVDVAQAQRVEQTALRALDQVAKAWKLDPTRHQPFVSWAASLHEIGLGIAHGGFHKHGAYLVANSDMPGFSFQDQKVLSLLVRGIRRKFPHDLFSELPAGTAETARRLCVLLRLAVLLNRGRSRSHLPLFLCEAKKRLFQVRLPRGWLTNHPLTGADLDQEAAYLRNAGYKLRIRSTAA